MADHLSRLTIAHDTHSPPINDEFPEESLMQLKKAREAVYVTDAKDSGSCLAVT